MLSRCSTFYLFIHLWKDILVAGISNYEKEAISICVLVLYGHMNLTPLSKYQGTWILDHMVRVCFVLYETAKLFFFFFNFAFQPAINESFCCSTCSSAIVIVSILEFSHSSVSSFYFYFLYMVLMLSLRNTISYLIFSQSSKY